MKTAKDKQDKIDVPATKKALIKDRCRALISDIIFSVVAIAVGITLSYFGKAALISINPNFWG